MTRLMRTGAGALVLMVALTASPAIAEPPPDEPEVDMTLVWNETEQDFDCLMNVTKLSLTSVGVIVTYINASGKLVWAKKAISDVTAIWWLIKAVNSCLSMRTVHEELWNLSKVPCLAQEWFTYPSKRKWTC